MKPSLTLRVYLMGGSLEGVVLELTGLPSIPDEIELGDETYWRQLTGSGRQVITTSGGLVYHVVDSERPDAEPGS